MFHRWAALGTSLLLSGCVYDDQAVDETAISSALALTVQNERAADTAIASSPTGAASKAGRTAWNGAITAQYLTVWQDSRNGTAAIYASRLNSTLGITDAAGIRISPSTLVGEQAEPVVAFQNGRYLVAWEDRGAGVLRLAAVTGAGVVSQLTSFAGGTRARITARTATESLLVYQANDDIYGVRVSGTTIGTAFPIAASAGIETEPSIGANPAGGYLVSYTLGVAPGRKLWGQLVTGAGGLDGAAFGIATGLGEHTQSDTSFVGGNFVVVWFYQGRRVGGSRVSTTGVVVDTHLENGVAFGGIPLAAESTDQPSIACGTSCFVGYRRRLATVDGTDTEGQLFDASLVASGGVATVRGGIAAQSAARVNLGAGNTYVATYTDERHNGGGSVFDARISASGAVLDAVGVLVPRGANSQGTPAAASNGAHTMIVWTDSRSLGNNIVGSRVTNNGGNVVDNPALTIGGADFGQGDATVTASGLATSTDFFVAWADRRNQHADVYGTIVTDTGVVRVANGLPIGIAADDQGGVQVASSSAGDYLVVWQDRRHLTSTKFDIYAAVVNANGTVGTTDIVVSNASGNQLYPSVAWDAAAGLYLLLWSDDSSGTPTLYGARMTRTGGVMDPNGVALLTGTAAIVDVTVAYGTDRFLAVWREGTATVRGTRIQVGASGISLVDTTGITIASDARTRRSPTVAYLGDAARRFLVVWSEATGTTTGADVVGNAVFESAGTLDGAAMTLAGGTADEVNPALSTGRAFELGQNKIVLLAYQRLDSATNTQRLFSRQLSYKAN